MEDCKPGEYVSSTTEMGWSVASFRSGSSDRCNAVERPWRRLGKRVTKSQWSVFRAMDLRSQWALSSFVRRSTHCKRFTAIGVTFVDEPAQADASLNGVA